MDNTSTMPALFIGHGSPMNAILDNPFTRMLKERGETLAKPKAILLISAHWLEADSRLSTTEKADTIYDFGGFPKELYEISYPVKGSKLLADLLFSYNQKRVRPWSMDNT